MLQFLRFFTFVTANALFALDFWQNMLIKFALSVGCFFGMRLGASKFSVFARKKINSLSNFQNETIEFYNILEFYISAIMPVAMVGTLLFIWHENFCLHVFHFISFGSIIRIFSVAILFLLMRFMLIFLAPFVIIMLQKKIGTSDVEMAKRLTTLVNLITVIVRSIIFLVGFVLIMILLQLNPAPIFANFWILTAGISISLQSLIKDLIVGVLVMFEDTFHIDDEVAIGGVEGQVEEINLRTLKVRANDGSLYFVPFNKIEVICNRSKNYNIISLDIAVDARADSQKVFEIMEKAGMELKQSEYSNKILEDVKVVGIISILYGCVLYEAKLKVTPMSPKGIKAVYYNLCKKMCEDAQINFAYDVVSYKKLFV